MTFICNLTLKELADEDPYLDNQKRFPVYVGHYPAGASLQDFDYFSQLITKDQFIRYDYRDEALNMEKYGQPEPPLYDLDSIKGMNIAMFVGTADKLANVEDNHWLRDRLGDNVIHYGEYELGHLSFMLAQDMTWFMTDAMDLINKYNGKE